MNTLETILVLKVSALHLPQKILRVLNSVSKINSFILSLFFLEPKPIFFSIYLEGLLAYSSFILYITFAYSFTGGKLYIFTISSFLGVGCSDFGICFFNPRWLLWEVRLTTRKWSMTRKLLRGWLGAIGSNKWCYGRGYKLWNRCIIRNDC